LHVQKQKRLGLGEEPAADVEMERMLRDMPPLPSS
jgi:hypothetical protein